MNVNNAADNVRKLDIDKRNHPDKMNERNYFKYGRERNDIHFNSFTGKNVGSERNLERTSIHKLDNGVDNKNSFSNNLTSTNINYDGCNKYPNNAKTQTVQEIEEIESSYTKETTTRIRPKSNFKNDAISARTANVLLKNTRNNQSSIENLRHSNARGTTNSSFETNHTNVGKFNSNGPNFISNGTHSSKNLNANNFKQTTSVKKDYDALGNPLHPLSQNNMEDIKSNVTKDAPPQPTTPKNNTKTLTIMMNMTKQKPREIEQRHDATAAEKNEQRDVDKLLNSSLLVNSSTKTTSFLPAKITDTPKLKNVSKIGKNSFENEDKIQDSSFKQKDGRKNVPITNLTGSNVVTPKNNSSENYNFSTRSEKIVPVTKPTKLHPSKSFDSQIFNAQFDNQDSRKLNQLNLENFREKHDFGDFQILTESPLKSSPPSAHHSIQKLVPPLTPQQLRVKRQILGKSFSIDV